MSLIRGISRLKIKEFGWLFGVAFLVVAAWILSSAFTYRVGFPLDDAWIHQTYARNLALRGEFAFLPGVPSAGSTAPLWTVLLVPGQLQGSAGMYTWTFLLGAVSLALIGLVGDRLFNQMTTSGEESVDQRRSRLPLVGLLLVSEWHLVWAAASGMETAFYSLAILVVLYFSWRASIPAFWIGFMIGAAVWIRPDGITLLGPAAMMVYFQESKWPDRVRKLGLLACGMLIPLAGYLAFNYLLSGSLWPSTFYAKQAEYSTLMQTSFLSRFVRLTSLPMVGIGVLLLPGFLYQSLKAYSQRKWNLVALVLWWIGYTGIYAYRLPVSYQHGRYLIPAMPVYFLLGLSGTVAMYRALRLNGRWKRRVVFAGRSIAILVTIAFLISGARAYSTDVAIIETEMVNTAHWLREHTSPGDLLAVHDIGAVGYFSERPILDLAGLASPEVIPFIRDEGKLAAYMDSRGTSVLVTFPGWYGTLARGKTILYQSGGSFSPAQGGENMAVYRWKDDE